MSSLDTVELKWSKGGMTLAAILGVFLTYYLASAHRTHNVTVTEHGKKVTRSVLISGEWLLLGVIILVFCGLGFLAIQRRKRTLVAFSFFVTGFSFTLIFAPIGFALIIAGGWLMLRAYRIQRFGTANAKMAAREAAARPPRRERKKTAAAPVKPTGHTPAKANKRYTPKAPARKKIAKPTE